MARYDSVECASHLPLPGQMDGRPRRIGSNRRARLDPRMHLEPALHYLITPQFLVTRQNFFASAKVNFYRYRNSLMVG